jgi:hypothetical protein
MPPERARLWLPALVVAAVVAIATALGSHLLLETGLRRSTPTLEEATRTGASAVGQAVAGQFAHALSLGIPLEKLPGIEPYLQRIAETSPQVDGLALLDGAGTPIASTGDDIDGVGFPIDAGGTKATLIVTAGSPLIDEAIPRLRVALLLASLLTGLVAGGIVAGFIAFHRDPIRHRLLEDMESVAAGDFRVSAPSADGGPLSEAARTLVRGMDKVKAARRNLVEAVATIRAIDFDGSLGRRVEAIVAPVESRYRFPDANEDWETDADSAVSGAGVAWRLALFVGLYGAAFPYVANFAIDRESELVAAAWAPVLPLLAELVGVAVGALVARTRFGRSGAALALGGLILAASLVVTYWCRTFELFVLLRWLAGISAGLVGTALMVQRRLDLPRIDVAALITFSGLLVAPLLAGLYAEAIGRRSGFLVLGIAVLFATPFIALGTGWAVRRQPPAARSFNRADLVVALAALPASAMLLVKLPAGIGPGGYLAATAAAATFAIFAMLAPRASAWVYGVILFLAGVILSDPVPELLVSMFAPCAVLGLACGGLVRSTIGEAGRPWAPIGLGTAAGLLLAGATASLDLSFAAVVACAALIVVGVAPRRSSSTMQPV